MTIEREEFRDLEDAVRKSDLNVVRLQEQVSQMQRTITELITRAEFAPVKMIAYGLATAVGSTVLMAILAKVIIK
jgi:hypothetical protein